MPGDDPIVLVDQDGVVKPKALNRARNLLNLLSRMGAGVPRVGQNIVGCLVFYLLRDRDSARARFVAFVAHFELPDESTPREDQFSCYGTDESREIAANFSNSALRCGKSG